MTVDASERAYARAALLLVLVGTALHLTYSTHLELVGDEAYYWLWSRRPDISYVDKGPMVAWFIRAGTSLFGQTVFGVRFFAAILAGGTGIRSLLVRQGAFFSPGWILGDRRGERDALVLRRRITHDH